MTRNLGIVTVCILLGCFFSTCKYIPNLQPAHKIYLPEEFTWKEMYNDTIFSGQKRKMEWAPEPILVLGADSTFYIFDIFTNHTVIEGKNDDTICGSVGDGGSIFAGKVIADPSCLILNGSLVQKWMSLSKLGTSIIDTVNLVKNDNNRVIFRRKLYVESRMSKFRYTDEWTGYFNSGLFGLRKQE